MLENLAYFGFLLGMTMLAIGNFGFRHQGAPAIGSGGFVWPWQARDRYRGPGFHLHLGGWLVWLASAFLLVFVG